MPMSFKPLPFFKMGSLGNCYIFIEAKNVEKYSLKKLAKEVSDTSMGIGADGLIIVDTAKPPFKMRILNRDGSPAEMCGNGIRQAALFLKSLRYPSRKKFLLVLPAGKFEAEVVSVKGSHAKIRTALGPPNFSAKAVGLINHDGLAFGIKMKYGQRKILADCVSIGNPHAIISVNNFDFDWQGAGYYICHCSLFPDGVNVHFLKAINHKCFEMRTYERGTGVTKACGSGAAACLAVGVIRGLLHRKAVAVTEGGKLELDWDFTTGMIGQTGPADIICKGVFLG